MYSKHLRGSKCPSSKLDVPTEKEERKERLQLVGGSANETHLCWETERLAGLYEVLILITLKLTPGKKTKTKHRSSSRHFQRCHQQPVPPTGCFPLWRSGTANFPTVLRLRWEHDPWIWSRLCWQLPGSLSHLSFLTMVMWSLTDSPVLESLKP